MTQIGSRVPRGSVSMSLDNLRSWVRFSEGDKSSVETCSGPRRKGRPGVEKGVTPGPPEPRRRFRMVGVPTEVKSDKYNHTR